MAWFLNPSLTRFRNEVNARWPHRDKASDGTIADAAHEATSSDHNDDPDGSVDAWDMDNNIVPGNNAMSDAIIYGVLIPAFQRHPAARYWIYQRKIAHRFEDNWAVKPYYGSSAHIEHVHWNSNQATENNISQWLPEVNDMDEATIAKAVMTYNLTPSGTATTAASAILNGGTLVPKIAALQADVAAIKTTVGKLATSVGVTDAQLATIVTDVVTALKSGAFKFEEDSTP